VVLVRETADFDRWYVAHEAELRAFVARLVPSGSVDDIVQEVFARAWANRDHLEGVAYIGPWLWRVARNLCADYHRKSWRVVTSDRLPETAVNTDPTSAIIRHEQQRAVVAALAELSERDREAIVLHDLQGVEYDDLAGRIGLTEGGTRARIFRARERLRAKLQDAVGVGAGWFVRIRDSVANRHWLSAIESAGGALAQFAAVVSMAGGIAAATMTAHPVSTTAAQPISHTARSGIASGNVSTAAQLTDHNHSRTDTVTPSGRSTTGDIDVHSYVRANADDPRVRVEANPLMANPVTHQPQDTGVDIYRDDAPSTPPPAAGVCPPEPTALPCI
jgi:RNA polymerase sigma-70 factor (ECF subfamily)